MGQQWNKYISPAKAGTAAIVGLLFVATVRIWENNLEFARLNQWNTISESYGVDREKMQKLLSLINVSSRISIILYIFTCNLVSSSKL